MSGGIRVGVDVGGTFTKAVALDPAAARRCARTRSCRRATPRPAGSPRASPPRCARCSTTLGDDRDRVELVAYSTTQAMNALLEGDVARVGVIGIGVEPELRLARKRTQVGDLKLAPGRVAAHRARLPRRDARPRRRARSTPRSTASRPPAAPRSPSAARSRSTRPSTSGVVAARARERGLPVCAGHELTGTYGLETRTVSAAVNASILPVVERTARVVEGVLREAGIDVPLLVLRGDGGAMSLEAFRAAPSFTIGSGPAAGVAAALHQLSLSDGIVLECGGTSSNVSVVKGGRTVLRTLRVMGRPTSIRSVDSWVVGAAGGSLGRVGAPQDRGGRPAQRARRRAALRLLRRPGRPRGRRARARRAARRRPRAVRRHRDAGRPPPRAHRDLRRARARPRRRRRPGRRRGRGRALAGRPLAAGGRARPRRGARRLRAAGRAG